MPGDVVLGRDGGVIFIPPQLAEQVVQSSELTHLRDLFGHQRLREGKYTAGQIDAAWTLGHRGGFHWLAEREHRQASSRASAGAGDLEPAAEVEFRQYAGKQSVTRR